MKFLNWFDSRTPAGSHLVIFGVVDGRILFNLLHNRTHPIGVTYERVYNFLNCHKLNPCWVRHNGTIYHVATIKKKISLKQAWLNNNETIRNAGSARAAQLNEVYRQVRFRHPFVSLNPLQLNLDCKLNYLA